MILTLLQCIDFFTMFLDGVELDIKITVTDQRNRIYLIEVMEIETLPGNEQTQYSKKPSETYQLINAENLVNGYIQQYEKLNKLKNTFDKFGATFYSQDAEKMRFEILQSISAITGQELSRTEVLSELSGGDSIQKALNSRDVF
ncbi:MAG TPA: hypothetical protein QF753_20735 [Victivallales bacterium]|nr:hypothetical protein [Victivallales bacterium]